MLDMFSTGKTSEEQFDILRDEIKNYQKKIGLENKKNKVKLFFGDVKNVGSGVLVITSPPRAKFFESSEDKPIINILKLFEIDKFFITYNYLLCRENITIKEIKEFSYFIKRLTDIICPKLIVCMGESSQFCFFKKKFMMIDFHGKQIGDYESIPIFTTYPSNYYEERSKHEDHLYKEQIRNKDWNIIKNRYEELK
jgi:hypothetical protein